MCLHRAGRFELQFNWCPKTIYLCSEAVLVRVNMQEVIMKTKLAVAAIGAFARGF
jgi:hypothetical protein